MTINEFFKFYSTGHGIFYWLNQNHKNDIDFIKNSQSDIGSFDIDFHSNYAVDAEIASHISSNISITPSNISDILYVRYKNSWNKLYETWTYDYNPLDNYNGEEHEAIDREIDTSRDFDNDVDVQTDFDTNDIINTQIDDDTTTTMTKDGTELNQHQVNGFNSPTVVNKSQDVLSFAEREDKTVVDGTVKNFGNTKLDQTTHTVTNNDIDENIGTEEHTVRNFTRHGNLGVTTSQQMSESEFEYRKKYNFLTMVYDDILRAIAKHVY